MEADRLNGNAGVDRPAAGLEQVEQLGLSVSAIQPPVGVLVAGVQKGPALGLIRAGDIIIEVNHRYVRSPTELERALRRAGEQVWFVVLRKEGQVIVPITKP